jgi:hypothetical protein
MDRNYPPAVESRARLERSGWSVAETAVITPRGVRWRVVGARSGATLEAHGESEREVWFRAVRRAEALGGAGQVIRRG